jgi:hypothetical protein
VQNDLLRLRALLDDLHVRQAKTEGRSKTIGLVSIPSLDFSKNLTATVCSAYVRKQGPALCARFDELSTQELDPIRILKSSRDLSTDRFADSLPLLLANAIERRRIDGAWEGVTPTGPFGERLRVTSGIRHGRLSVVESDSTSIVDCSDRPRRGDRAHSHRESRAHAARAHATASFGIVLLRSAKHTPDRRRPLPGHAEMALSD